MSEKQWIEVDGHILHVPDEPHRGHWVHVFSSQDVRIHLDGLIETDSYHYLQVYCSKYVAYWMLKAFERFETLNEDLSDDEHTHIYNILEYQWAQDWAKLCDLRGVQYPIGETK